ncbi:hypothetical protein YC2023_066284 [Brassica napus]
MQGATQPHTCRSACFDCMRRDISCLADPPRAPHGWLHVQDTCRTPPLLPDVRLHDWNSCKAPQHHTHGWPHASVPCAETPRAWPFHLVLLCVWLHGLLPCTSTPPPCVDTELVRWLTPRTEPMQHATSSFSVHWPDFGPSVHTGRPWVSASTHRTSVAVCGCPSAHTGRPCVSVSTHKTFVAVCVCPSAHTGRSWLSIIHTGRPWVSASTHMTSVAVCGCPSPHTGHPCVSMCVCHHTQDVRGCPSAHTGRPCVSVSIHRTSVAVRVCPSTLCTLALPVDCLVHTGRPWVSASTHRTSVAVRVCPSAHTGHPWLSLSTHIRTLVLGLNTLAFPVDYLGDFIPRGLSVQYTQDICGCLPAHTVRSWLSVSTHRKSETVRVCPCVSVCVRQHTQDVLGCPSVHISAHCTHRTCVGVRQHTQNVRVCSSAHTGRPGLSVCVCVCPSAHTGRSWLSISTHISTLVLGLSTLTLPVDCSGDFGPRGLSGQYTQDGRGCPPAHTGHLWLSVCVCVCSSVSISKHRTSVAVHHTHRTSVGVRQRTQHVCGCPLAHTQHVRGCPCVSVGVRQHTHDIRSCKWLSVSTHRTSVCVRQHTQDVRVCPSAHTGRLCVSMCDHPHTQDIRSCPSVHISARWSLDSAHCPFLWTVWVILAHVGSLFGTHMTSVGVRQHTQDVRLCPSAHTGHLGLSVCVRVCPSAHRGRLWLSISTHINTLVLGLSTLTVPADCSGDFGPRGLCVQYTQDVRGCLPAHTVLPWLF